MNHGDQQEYILYCARGTVRPPSRSRMHLCSFALERAVGGSPASGSGDPKERKRAIADRMMQDRRTDLASGWRAEGGGGATEGNGKQRQG
eukprot:2915228-Rhodomonas_salina.1